MPVHVISFTQATFESQFVSEKKTLFVVTKFSKAASRFSSNCLLELLACIAVQ